MKRERKGIRFAPFAIASLFLFNPMMGTIDILPDFIGYLLISRSLVGLCEINEHFVEARGYFNKLLYISIAKFGISAFMLFKNFLSGEIFILLYLFVFSALSVIFGLPAIAALKKGIQYLPMYSPSALVDKPITKGSRVSKNELVGAVTSAFLVLHAVLTTVPELFVLGKTDEYGNVNYQALVNQGTARMISFFTLLAFGVMWVVIICVYFASVCRDKPFLKRLEEIYLEKNRYDENALVSRQLGKGLALILLAFVFSIDIFIDDVNFFPSAISAILVIFAARTLKGYVKFKKRYVIISVLSSVAGIVKLIAEIAFNQKFTYANMAYYEVGRRMYSVLTASNVVDSLLHCAVLAVAILLLRELISHHTGFSTKIGEEYYSDPKIVELHKSLLRGTVPLAVFSALRTATSIFYYYAQAHSEWYFELALYYHLSVTVCLLIIASSLLKKVGEEVSYKYMISKE